MAMDQKSRQKKLAKKAKKRKKAISSKKRPLSFGEKFSRKKALIVAQNSPVHNCYIRKDIFTGGIGSVIISREMPNNYLGCGIFLLDVWCLGVKNTYFTVLSEKEYADRLDEIGAGEELETIHPSCARKIIEQCVDYSMELGFKPQKDYKISSQIFMNIDPSVCPNKYIFGKDGKPFYISGPNESESDSRRIINTLSRKCGEGNFDYIAGLSQGFDED